MHAPKHVNGTDTLGVSQPASNHRAPRVNTGAFHRDLAWSVPLAATAATLMAREAATEGAAVAQDAGGLSSTPYDPTGTLPELATMLATAPWEPSPNTLRMCSEGLHSLSLSQSPHGLCGVPFSAVFAIEGHDPQWSGGHT